MRALVLLLVCAAPTLSAQDPVAEPGDRIRVTLLPGQEPRVGVLEGLRSQEITFRIGSSTETAPLARVKLLEVSRGHRPGLLGGILGAVLGVGVGGVVGCLANKDDYGVFCAGQSDTKVAVGALAGALAGGALGAWLGRRERWIAVPIPRP